MPVPPDPEMLRLEIPARMQLARRWLLWRAEGGSQTRKPRKVPYYVDGTRRQGALDTDADRSKLGTFDAALMSLASGNWTGVGFALGQDEGGYWQGIDLDDTAGRPAVEALIEDLPGYVERSPSGRGVHAIGFGARVKSLGANGSGIEAYGGRRYFTVTGDAIGGNIEDLSDYIASVLAPRHAQGTTPRKGDGAGRSPATPVSEDLLPELRSALEYLGADDYGLWVRMGLALRSLGEEGRGLWLEWSQKSEKYDCTDANRRRDTFEPNSIDYRAVLAEAQRRGWVNPRSRGPHATSTTGPSVPAQSGDDSPAPQHPRPIIRAMGGALHVNMEAAVQALAALRPPRVFQRGQTLCRVAHLEETDDSGGCTIPAGTATIVTLQRAGLMVELAKAAKWVSQKGKTQEWCEVDPCPKVAAATLEAVGDWSGIPSLVGISEAPILRDDGTLHAQAGYDPASGLYVEGRFPAVNLPQRITLDDAQRAAMDLLQPFLEFPFVESRLDHAVVLAYLLTLAQRPQLLTAPLFCVSATTPGTGKGLLVEACNLLVRGRDAAIMPAIQGNSAEEETRKRITALLLQGVSSINLDNWTRPIGGESMNALLTTDEWTDRVLGRSETVTLPARLTLAATGNNLSVRGDMTRRSLLIQLDAGVERPELRKFQQPNLGELVLRQRGALLGALFTILEGYRQAQRPDPHERLLGRFEVWSKVVAAPIRWLGYPDPIESQDRLRAADPEAEKLELFLAAWFDLRGGAWTTAGELAQEATPHGTSAGDPNGKRAALAEALLEIANDGRGGINRKSLGWYLRHFEGRPAGGLKLIKEGRRGNQKHAHRYRIEQVSEAETACADTDDVPF